MCQAHDPDIPICGNAIASNCTLDAGKLRQCWENYTKASKSTAFVSLPPGSEPRRVLKEDFHEKKVLEFLKEKRPNRDTDGLLPIPQKVLVVPFLQTILEEVSRIVLELGSFANSPRNSTLH